MDRDTRQRDYEEFREFNRRMLGETHRHHRDEERWSPPREREAIPVPAYTVTRGMQTRVSGSADQTEAATQTTGHDEAAMITSARGAAVWISGQFLADKLVSPEAVVSFLPSLTLLEAEVMIVAVGEGMGAANRAAASAQGVPMSLARNVCLLAEHEEPTFMTPPVVVSPLRVVVPRQSVKPAFVAPAPAEGKALTAAAVKEAARRAKIRREHRLPTRLPAGTDPEAERRYLSLLFKGRDTEAAQLRAELKP
jgi:hypothetical protein